jgi:hypothetical protein
MADVSNRVASDSLQEPIPVCTVCSTLLIHIPEDISRGNVLHVSTLNPH